MSEENNLDSSENIYTDLVATEDIKPILDILPQEDAEAIVQLRDELTDNWKKKQVFRTETEMRISVLNDAKHPTTASKYWQSVREMGAMFDALMGASFDLRRNNISRKRLEAKMEEAIEKDDVLLQEEIKIDMDENLWSKANMQKTAHDRVRELKLWSQIKDELDDGTFDKENVNTHQAHSYLHNLSNRVKSLSEHSQPAEIVNAAGPLQTVQRLMTDDGTNRLRKFDGGVDALPETSPIMKLQRAEEQKKLQEKSNEN